MKERKSFEFSKEWYDAIKCYEREQQLEIYSAVMAFVFEGKEINVSDNVKGTVMFITQQIEQKAAKKSAEKSISDSAWRKDKSVYVSFVDKAEEELQSDEKSREEFLRMFPNGDYRLTIMRTADFWRSDRGYEYKLKGRSKTLNIKSTIKNNWDKNVVYVKDNYVKSSNQRSVVIGGEEWQQ